MYISKRKISPDSAKRSVLGATIVLYAVFGLLLFVYWHTQILNNGHYTRLAVNNMIRNIELVAPRGQILDRRGRLLCENTIHFSLFLDREKVTDLERSVGRASFLSGKTQAQVHKLLEKYRKYPRNHPIPLRSDLPLASVVAIQSREDEFPEFTVAIEPIRTYPGGKVASHVLGYISEISQSELDRELYAGYQMGDVIGRSGIEKVYEKDLKGTKGVQTVIKDNLERVHEVVRVDQPEIGDTVVLTIDLELQRVIGDLFADQNGAAGVVDLATGGLLALVSKPDFDPGLFATQIEAGEWQQLISDPQKPLQNKFSQGLYSPGSVFKIVMALAALQEGVITTDNFFSCAGSTTIYDRVFHCWNAGGHGSVNVVGALKNSCNIFFYQLGKRLDVDVIHHYATLFGLGRVAGLDLPSEKRGLIPSTEWKQHTFRQKWFPGETISVAVGQGSTHISPAQILRMISTVALRGRSPHLHLLDRVERHGTLVRRFPPRFDTVPIAREHFETVIEGLYQVVNGGGTGGAANIPGQAICGKTGTAQVITKENPNYKNLVKEKRFRPHSWFASFAPRDNPRIAMVVLVENGGDGGAVAAPLAQKIYRWYFDHER